MTVDNKLNWKSQIDNVSSDLSSKLKKLIRIKSLPPLKGRYSIDNTKLWPRIKLDG